MKIKHLTLISLIFLASCSDDKSSETSEEKAVEVSEIDKTNVDQDSIDNGFNEPTVKLPSPLQIAMLFQESGLDYSENFTLSKDHYNQIDHSEKNSLLCLGAYSSDLAYNCLHQQEGAAFETLDLINIISQDLGYATNLNTPERIKRFEQSIHNIDSMAVLIADLEYDIEGYIRANNEERRSLIIFTGAWIETLELARKAFNDNGDTDLAFLIMEQQHISSDLLELMRKENVTKDGSLAEIHGIVIDLEKKLNVFDLEGDELEISQDDFDALMNSIENAHNTLFKL